MTLRRTENVGVKYLCRKPIWWVPPEWNSQMLKNTVPEKMGNFYLLFFDRLMD